MLGIGSLTVAGLNAAMFKNDKIAFKVEFSAYLTATLFLSQSSFSGTLDKSKTRVTIKLRDKAPTWIDLRTTLLYYWMIPKGSGNGAFPFKINFFEKDTGILADYLKIPFYGTAKAVTTFQPNTESYSYKIHPKLATLFKLPEEFDTEEQSVEVFATQNNVETLLHKRVLVGAI